MDKEKDGVWRTIRGRRIFIAKGESLSSAMAKSGKFTENRGMPKREDVMKGKKELKRQEAVEKWHKEYAPNKYKASDYQDPKKRTLMEKRREKVDKEFEKTHKEKDDFMELYDKDTPENEMTWQDRVERNNRETNRKTKELEEQRGKGKYMFHEDNWADDYYGKFRENEERNARIKEEPDDAPYEPIQAYKGYKEKFDKHGERDTWSGKEYTNDEFMEHLEDANWHTERKMIEEAGLTNKQMTELKNQVKLSQWSADLDPKKTQELIDKVKKEFPAKDTKKTIENFKAKKQSNNKVESERKWEVKSTAGFGQQYGEGNIPIRDGQVDYESHFGSLGQNLTLLSDKELKTALETQQKMYDKYSSRPKSYDARTRNGRMERIFRNSELTDARLSVEALKKEVVRRENEKHPQYKGTDYEVKYASVKDAINDPNSKINQYIANKQSKNKSLDDNTYKFGKQKYNTRVEKNFDNYGRADKEEAINNEIEKTIKRYKQRKGK